MTADSPIVELTWREAEQRFQLRVDHRMRYATDGVQLLVLLRWAEACTGCCVLGCDWDQGVGCRECGFTGKRRVEIWHPERLWAANKPPKGAPCGWFEPEVGR